MVLLYKAEAELFKDIRHVRFGELYDVEVPQEGQLVDMDLSPSDEIFLGLLRDGINDFCLIGIHDAEPSHVVVSGITRNGNRFRRKIKIS